MRTGQTDLKLNRGSRHKTTAYRRPMWRSNGAALFPAMRQRKYMSESFAALFEESLKRAEMRTGEVITAEVVRIEHNLSLIHI